jgi:hypothetical protein
MFVVCLTLGAGPVAAQSPDKNTAAIEAAKSWLSLVDAGEYAKSWQNAAEYFKSAVTEKTWKKSITAARNPLGKLISRKVNSATYTTSLPGAPDGEYVVIQFTTSFANKRSAIETVTPMLEKNGTWRVSGYYIK